VAEKGTPWKVLIVDDEQEVHDVTRFALAGFDFDEKELLFLDAYSAKEAKLILNENPDVAVILLDVVMESDDSGLQVVKYIRDELGNKNVRIILRTGQPGHAPERSVVRDFDINDYKAKTELTAQKLFTLMLSSLRSFRDIVSLEKNKRGLEKVIQCSRGIFEKHAMDQFVEGAIEQLVSLLFLDHEPSLYSYDSLAIEVTDTSKIKPLCGFGKFSMEQDLCLCDLPECLKDIFKEAINTRQNVFRANDLVIYCEGQNRAILMYVDGHHVLSELDKELLDVFTKNVVSAYENIEAHEKNQQQTDDLVAYLAELTECRDQFVGRHTKRVAEISVRLGEFIGLSAEDLSVLRTAAPLHDFGNIMVPEDVLHKKGHLTEEEMQQVKTHASRGAKLLGQADQGVLKLAGLIAQDHHEKWDGTGYPEGKAGDEIHIMGRIVAIADVFDLLACKRSYREPWPMNDIVNYFQEQKGKHFDPALVDLLLNNLDEFNHIREQMPDPENEVSQ
jgi:response regulator RpfG family c-di-GMP phosphodiesterase